MSRSLAAALLLAALPMGCGSGESGTIETADAPPGRTDLPEPWFEESALSHGIEFTYDSGADGDYHMPEIMGGGAALFDMDSDGDLDLYLTQGGPLLAPEEREPNRLFENTGGGRFRDVTAGSGAGDRGYGNGVACGDVDGDGDIDLYITNTGRNTLLLNEGAGHFRDATAEAGVGDTGWGTSAAFLDYDADGDLDLFVTNYLRWSVDSELPCLNALSHPDYCSPKNYRAPARDVLFENLGDGHFRDVSEPSGIASSPGNGLGVGCADFDGDGRVDIFVANDGMPDHLWINGGDGTFENRAFAWGCATDANGLNKAGMGVALGDLDGDLDVDLMVCNLDGESDSMFLNQGGFFQDHTVRGGVAATSKHFTRFGMGWVDFDNDGEFDLFQADGRVEEARGSTEGDPYAEENLLFRGLGAGRFEEVLPRGGVFPPLVATSRAAAFGDVNEDGAVDVVVVNRDAPVHLLLNRRGTRNRWIELRVLGADGSDALGATLTARVGARTLRRDVRAAYSYQASNDPRVHIGLGSGGTGLDQVTVRFPDGHKERFGPLSAGKVHVLRRGEGAPVEAE
ncbi:MAG TPA: CRTAC1 family protein [Planctomycetes bacterium]|nr:CRTAC1 family protein [Planctomycetota bacterium]